MKCEDCGKEISKEQDKENSRIAEKTQTKKLNMCSNCWTDFCYHVETGQ